VVVEAPFVYGTRHKFNQRGSFSSYHSMDNTKPSSGTLKSQLSLQMHPNPANDLWSSKNKKKQRQHSSSFGSQNNPIGRKPGRPKREVSDRFVHRFRYESCHFLAVRLSTGRTGLSNTSIDSLRWLSRRSARFHDEWGSTVASRFATRNTTSVDLEYSAAHKQLQAFS
jgi:hypothetical protein